VGFPIALCGLRRLPPTPRQRSLRALGSLVGARRRNPHRAIGKQSDDEVPSALVAMQVGKGKKGLIEKEMGQHAFEGASQFQGTLRTGYHIFTDSL
jgi:hypothetical protein